MSKLETNEDLVRDLMDYSPRGTLCQAFVVYAIEHYCDEVLRSDPSAYHSALIDGQAWFDIAKDTKRRIAAFYGRGS